ncbi:hypothetical protein [Brucella intermedia]|nr:hypothetical protein [Brucella intermedia]
MGRSPISGTEFGAIAFAFARPAKASTRARLVGIEAVTPVVVMTLSSKT